MVFSFCKNFESEPSVKLEEQVVEEKNEKDLLAKNRKIKVSISDPIFQPIIMEILEAYGYPETSDSCMNKSEKIMYVVALMSTIQSLQRDEELTNELLNSLKKDKTFLFLEKYYEKFGHHAIPSEDEMESPDVLALLKTGEAQEKK